MKERILALIRSAAVETRPEVAEALDEHGDETRLLGRNGHVDSLGLVTLIAAVEREIEDQFDACVMLADERAMSRENSPFRTVGTLAEYAEELIREQDRE